MGPFVGLRSRGLDGFGWFVCCMFCKALFVSDLSSVLQGGGVWCLAEPVDGLSLCWFGLQLGFGCVALRPWLF